ncbi:MAG: DMT family transporter [Fervidobacterium sp.]
MVKNNRLLAYFYLAFTLLSFSSIEVVSKPLMGKIDPFFMTAFRFLIGGLTLMFFVKEDISFNDFIPITLIGSLNSMVSMTALQLSVKYSNASTAATLVASNPIFVSLFAWIILKEKYSIKKYFGILLGFIGLVIFSFGKIHGDSWLGIFYGILAALTFGLYTVFMRKYTRKYGALKITAYSSLSSAIVYVLLLSLSKQIKIPTLSVSQWMILVYLGFVVTGVAYLTFFKAMECLGTAQSSRIFFLKPIVATILAVILLNEGLNLVKVIGMIIVLLSLTL